MSEIEPFPRAVLAHHWPAVPLHGDFTTIEAGQYEPIKLLVGGTPCQSFSVAGLRGGLADERGNLALQFLRLAARLRPRWVVWENVPGVLSSTSHDAPDPRLPPDHLDEGAEWVGEDEYDADESHAFSCFLAGLSELGYGWAYRVLDAQYYGVPQRRRRVFVVGCLGDWRRAVAVLFERASLSGHPPPRREAGEGTPEGSCAGTLGGSHGNVRADEAWTGRLVGVSNSGSEMWTEGGARLGAHPGRQYDSLVAHALRAAAGAQPPAVAFNWQSGGDCRINPTDERTDALHAHQTPAIHHAPTVRRLTPRECERLQGFPDDYTLIPVKRVSRSRLTSPRAGYAYREINGEVWQLAADGPRYQVLGNSMAVAVVRWLGQRIQLVDSLIAQAGAA